MKWLSLFIGLRYTKAKRRNHFISFISLVSIIGIALGVMVLITVMSVLNGFDTELKNKILGLAPHVTLYGMHGGMDDWPAWQARTQKYPGVVAATPFINGQGLLTHEGLTHFVMIQGINPILENKVLHLDKQLITGHLTDLTAGRFNIFLGKKLADSLALDVGDKVTLVLPEASTTIAGVLPRLKRFTVAGIFELGVEFDNSLGIIELHDAQKIFQLGDKVTGLNLRLTDLYQAPALSQEIRAAYMDQIITTDWTVRNGNFFKAVKMEKTMMFILLLFIVLVATFNILATLIMVVTEKKADIAILRTLGASQGLIMRVFIVQGAYIGFVGTILGLLSGLYLATHITEFTAAIEHFFHIKLLSSDVYFINYLPSQIQFLDVVSITASAFLMSLLFTLYPAWRAAKTPIAEALRYE